MLDVWDAIEADFMRDYRIDLSVQLNTMSWRRFSVLLNNLNPDGAVSARIRVLKEKPNLNDNTDDEDKRAADRFFSSLVQM